MKIRIISILTILFGYVINSPSYSQQDGIEGESEKRPFEKRFEVVESYKNKNVDSFESMDDFFDVMKFYDFPNLKSYSQFELVKHLDFTNPKSIKEYLKIMEPIRKNEEEQFKNPLFLKNSWEPLSQDQLDAQEEERKKAFIELEKFKKDIYYQFFKKKLTKSPDTPVQVCFDIDTVSLGLNGLEGVLIPIDHADKIIADRVMDVISSYGFKAETVTTLSIHDPLVSCHGLISVNLEELNRLYFDDSIASLMNPEKARPTSFRIH